MPRAGLVSRIGLIAVIGASIASCQRLKPSIFVNATGSDVVIRYQAMDCRDRWPPRSRDAVVTSWNWDDNDWVSAATSDFDTASCTTSITVPARTSVVVEMNVLCDDYEPILERFPSTTPAFSSFTVTSPRGSIELKGWESARVFKDHGDVCIYKFS